ncbi:pupal cuticle protein-like [Achroia grisella]|uniref:pupal cuticle protein-like n=1 Tax=Achroia grisella TaxID=688607 RepID=UPI0027D282CD|nr:pupal cuticle protein-like [Achroia grisella]
MQSMIILAATLCLAQASYYAGPPAHIQLSPDGKYVLDTPEVAHAKQAHYAAHAQASSAHGAWAPAAGYLGAPAAYAAGHYGAPAAGLLKYGPAPLAHDGRVVDTPEVAHLKAAHAQAHAHAAHGSALAPLGHGPIAPLSYAAPLAHGAGYAAGYGKWTGPPAHIQLTHDGQYVVDTPEVQHARAAHLAQYAAAAHAAAASPEEPWGHGPQGWH